MGESWLKLYRKITEWEWYTNSSMVHLFLHLLIMASSTNRKWKGTTLRRGQLITGRLKLSGETGIPETTIRRCLKRLEESGEIEIKTTNKYSIVTICRYDSYQHGESLGEPTKEPIKEPTSEPSREPTVEPHNKNRIIKESKKTSSLSPNVDNEFPTRTREAGGEVKDEETKRTRPGAKRKLKSGTDVTLVTRCREVYEAYYSELYGEKPYTETKDMVALKKLLQKIEFSRKNRQTPLSTDEDSLVEAFTQFIKSINKSWIMDNFSLPKINSQYNDIISEIKNSRNNGAGKNISHTASAGVAIIANQRAAVIDDIAKADELYYQQQ